MKWWAIFCAALVLIVVHFLDWRNRAAFIGSSGHIAVGSRQGVVIGVPVNVATSVLSRQGYTGRRFPADWRGQRVDCGDFAPNEGDEVMVFYEETRLLRTGTVCVVARQGRVIVFGWTMGLPMP